MKSKVISFRGLAGVIPIQYGWHLENCHSDRFAACLLCRRNIVENGYPSVPAIRAMREFAEAIAL